MQLTFYVHIVFMKLHTKYVVLFFIDNSMARNPLRKHQRNRDIKAYFQALKEKNKVEKKYRTDYLVEQTAKKFYLESRTIYAILRQEEPVEDPNQLQLFAKV